MTALLRPPLQLVLNLAPLDPFVRHQHVGVHFVLTFADYVTRVDLT